MLHSWYVFVLQVWYLYYGNGTEPMVVLSLYAVVFCVFSLGLSIGVVLAVGMLLCFQVRYFTSHMHCFGKEVRCCTFLLDRALEWISKYFLCNYNSLLFFPKLFIVWIMNMGVTNALGFMNVILLYSNHWLVWATHVSIFRVSENKVATWVARTFGWSLCSKITFINPSAFFGRFNKFYASNQSM